MKMKEIVKLKINTSAVNSEPVDDTELGDSDTTTVTETIPGRDQDDDED